jgi:hypothetical protein
MQIDVSRIEPYLQLQRLELTFRIKLTQYKEMKEKELEFVKELKAHAERLTNFRRMDFGKLRDKELDKDIFKMLNKQLPGLKT